VSIGLPGDHSDDHARFIEAVFSSANGALRVANLANQGYRRQS
jgi:exodeoxyribonuclease III